MTKLETIQQAISELSADELAKLRAYLDELEADLWDAEIERDLEAGKFDKIAAKAIEEDDTGTTTDL